MNTYIINKNKSIKITNKLSPIFLVFIILLFFIPYHAFTSSTPTGTWLHMIIGSGCNSNFGDYVSSNNALNTYVQFYIEVPSGLSRLDVDIFDADVGMNGDSVRDNNQGGSWNSSCTYTLYNPSGTQVATMTGNTTGPASSDNAWLNLYTTTSSIPNGHWELRINMSSSVTSGTCVNGFGIRTHDGNSGSGGTELNMYAHSYAPVGEIGATPVTTTVYPYVTSGCTVDWNEWDGDSQLSISYTSRTGNTTGSYSGSGATVWLNNPISNYTTDILASDYGIWSTGLTYSILSNGNYGTFYVGEYNASNPPPSSQPQSNTLRIYLPTDGASGPLKPVVSQNVSHISGPNPPAVGSTTTLLVEVAVFNPTPHSITFSSTNMVEAYVPSGATYVANSISATQGTIVENPSTASWAKWNPGTVTGNTNWEYMYYRVTVQPTISGQRIPVTGSPGSNGTFATYVDETGNTTQSRATYTFGPLCELAVTEGNNVPTLASISSFNAYQDGGRMVVQWETGSEIGTTGFYLLRKDKKSERYYPVNQSLLQGLINSPQGGIYRFVDETAQYGETVTYKLVEVDARGRRYTHGPFTVTVGSNQRTPTRKGIHSTVLEPMQGTYAKTPHKLTAARNARFKAEKQTITKSSGFKTYKKIKIAIKNRGIYFVSDAKIADLMGESLQHIQGLIHSHNLMLLNRGKPVAWFPAPMNSGIYFYGEQINSIYTDKNIYWLQRGQGQQMDILNSGKPLTISRDNTYTEFLHLEEDRYALTAIFDNPEDDFWVWNFFRGNGIRKTFKFHIMDVANSGKANLTLNLKGGTNGPSIQDHHVRVHLNGSYIGESRWDGTKAHTFHIPFNQSLLHNGENKIELKSFLNPRNSFSIFHVDSFDLLYQRYCRAINNRMMCRGGGKEVIAVGDFSDPNIMVFEVSDPWNTRYVANLTVDASNRVSFVPSSLENLFYIVSSNGLDVPVSVVPDRPSTLKRSQNSANYILIVPERLAGTANRLAQLRQRRGFETKVVRLEDIYDEFNHGTANPAAIRDFLNYAYHNWSGNIPKYVCLVGKGTYDYKDNLGYGENLIPPKLIKTPHGLFASDGYFGDVIGGDGIPEIAIGRIPVLTNEELQIFIDKLAAYEDASGAWTSRVMMVSDRPDEKNDFPQDSDNLVKFLSEYSVEKIHLSRIPKIARARERLFNGINSGAFLVNYIGHAGLDHLSRDGLLWVGDVPLLSNQDRLPILTAMTCVLGRFTLPGYETLSEALLLKRNGGVVGVVAPSGASFNSQATVLAEAFFEILFQYREKTIGNILRRAMENYVVKYGYSFILNIYNLLGDPAMEIK